MAGRKITVSQEVAPKRAHTSVPLAQELREIRAAHILAQEQEAARKREEQKAVGAAYGRATLAKLRELLRGMAIHGNAAVYVSHVRVDGLRTPEAVESRLACLSFWEQALRNEDLLEAKITQDHDWHYRLEVSWVP
jgi:hypothetical protein